jgi:hypothetical protein
MTNLRSALRDIATTFAVGVYNAVRSASLDELRAGIDEDDLRGSGGTVRAAGAKTNGAAASTRPAWTPSSPSSPHSPSARLPRRSGEEIAKALDQIVALVKKNKEGLRAEQIRAQLGLQAKELPRILKEGIATKKLKTRGQKRATTYLAV